MALTMALGSTSISAKAAVVSRSPVSRCEGCHSHDGDSQYHLVPRINGQAARYIVRRLNQLGQASNGHSAGITHAHGADLSDRQKMQVAEYFSGVKPTDAEKPDRKSLGARLYRDGIAANNVAACAYCHGANGEGSGPVPRLAGQHKAYLTIRLDLLSGIPLEGSGAMHLAVRNVTPEEIDAITSYLAAQ